jgi:outer membrane protein assembly factor BamA
MLRYTTLAALLLCPSVGLVAESGDEEPKTTWRDRFIDPEDGMFDASDYLERPGAFLVVPVVITEPAVGYGLGLTAVFLQPREEAGNEGWKRPDISGVIGLRTENDTKGYGAFDMRYWRDGAVKTTAFGLSASVNLDFYVNDTPLRYNLDTAGGLIGGEFQTGIEHLSVAVKAHYFEVTASYQGSGSGLPPLGLFDETTFAGGAVELIYDTRDNLFSPQRGLYLQTALSANDSSVGASDDFHSISQVVIRYWPLGEHWTLGTKVQAEHISGDYPFYAKPFVSLRGVPAMRFQGESVAFTELELQRIVTPRFRLLGFVGGGMAWDDVLGQDREQSVISGGIGARYRIARKFGLDMGIDLAFSEEETTFYIQFGSAWLRP